MRFLCITWFILLFHLAFYFHYFRVRSFSAIAVPAFLFGKIHSDCPYSAVGFFRLSYCHRCSAFTFVQNEFGYIVTSSPLSLLFVTLDFFLSVPSGETSSCRRFYVCKLMFLGAELLIVSSTFMTSGSILPTPLSSWPLQRSILKGWHCSPVLLPFAWAWVVLLTPSSKGWKKFPCSIVWLWCISCSYLQNDCLTDDEHKELAILRPGVWHVKLSYWPPSVRMTLPIPPLMSLLFDSSYLTKVALVCLIDLNNLLFQGCQLVLLSPACTEVTFPSHCCKLISWHLWFEAWLVLFDSPVSYLSHFL